MNRAAIVKLRISRAADSVCIPQERLNDKMLLETCQEGVIISIRACPGARRNEVRYADGVVKVYVTQIPEKGKANESIRKQLAQSLNLRASQVELLQGETSQQKKFLLGNVTMEDILNTLDSYS